MHPGLGEVRFHSNALTGDPAGQVDSPRPRALGRICHPDANVYVDGDQRLGGLVLSGHTEKDQCVHLFIW